MGFERSVSNTREIKTALTNYFAPLRLKSDNSVLVRAIKKKTLPHYRFLSLQRTKNNINVY